MAITVQPGDAPLQLKLEEAKLSDWILPSCATTDPTRRVGFSVFFALPKTVESTSLDTNAGPAVFVYPRGGDAAAADLIISHSPDELKDAGNSLDYKQFEERWIKDVGGNVLGIDAYGRGENGQYWRTAIFLSHDEVTYTLQPGKSTSSLNRIINSACLAGTSSH